MVPNTQYIVYWCIGFAVAAGHCCVINNTFISALSLVHVNWTKLHTPISHAAYKDRQLQNERAQATRQRNKKIWEEKKARDEAAKSQKISDELNNRRANFFAPRPRTAIIKDTNVLEAAEGEVGAESSCLDFGNIEEGSADVATTIHNPAITDIYAPAEPVG